MTDPRQVLRRLLPSPENWLWSLRQHFGSPAFVGLYVFGGLVALVGAIVAIRTEHVTIGFITCFLAGWLPVVAVSVYGNAALSGPGTAVDRAMDAAIEAKLRGPVGNEAQAFAARYRFAVIDNEHELMLYKSERGVALAARQSPGATVLGARVDVVRLDQITGPLVQRWFDAIHPIGPSDHHAVVGYTFLAAGSDRSDPTMAGMSLFENKLARSPGEARLWRSVALHAAKELPELHRIEQAQLVEVVLYTACEHARHALGVCRIMVTDERAALLHEAFVTHRDALLPPPEGREAECAVVMAMPLALEPGEVRA